MKHNENPSVLPRIITLMVFLSLDRRFFGRQPVLQTEVMEHLKTQVFINGQTGPNKEMLLS